MPTSFKFFLKIIHTIFFIAIQLYITSAIAENTSSEIQLKNNDAITSELSKIKQDRQSIEEKYKVQETACYKKFAVNDCLKDVRTHKLASLNTLKRREIELNDSLRQSKIIADQEKRSKIVEKNLIRNDATELNNPVVKEKRLKTERTEKAQRSSSKERSVRAVRLPASAADEKNRIEAASKRAAKTQEKLASSQIKKEARIKKSKQANVETDKYNKKIQEVEAHKNTSEKAKLTKTKPKSAPLPMPADLKP